jgi:hypothetical protein
MGWLRAAPASVAPRGKWVLRRLPALLVPALVLMALPAGVVARVLIVTKRHVGYPHYTSIQRAVNAARPGDWIVIDRGVYPESVRITKRRLHLRGVNRNRVIVDGRHRKGNGIEVDKASGVWIENLTVRNFDRRTRDDSATGNEIWWNGGDGSGRIGMNGWWGQYLTAYDTGLLGGYGLFTNNAINGWWKHVYASGFNDSGIYIGACRDCHALVQDALVERNALGYSGTNSGGHVVVERSVFRDNGVGIGPDSEATDDLPPPQDGACASGSNRSPTPTFSSTRISRCTIFRHNLIANNGNINTPANSILLGAPWGVGIELPGVYADLIQSNTIRGNPNFGVLVHERPHPFPPTPQTIFFQASGNRISGNRLSGNGTRLGGADIGLEGGAFGSMKSVNNCFATNAFMTSIPANIQGIWGCQNATTSNGGLALVSEIFQLINESGARHAQAQPAPRRQRTMPHPCRGVPRNPLCR